MFECYYYLTEVKFEHSTINDANKSEKLLENMNIRI